MNVPDYLKMGTKEANACDFAHKLEQQEMIDILECTSSSATTN
jgi:hypothetical protein